MAGGAFRVEHVEVEGQWCHLVLFAASRALFVARANELGLPLPHGWRQTRPLPLGHTCGRDELVHLCPLEAPSGCAGALPDLTAMLAAAAVDAKRGTVGWRIEQAASATARVVAC